MQVWQLALDGDLLMHSICILVEKYGKRPAFKICLKIQGRIAKIDAVGGSWFQMCKKKSRGRQFYVELVWFTKKKRVTSPINS